MADEYNGPEYGRFLNEAGVRRISRSAKIVLSKTHKIATWNVRSMYEAGKIHNAIKEMDRLGIDILGISEMRWPNSGQTIKTAARYTTQVKTVQGIRTELRS